MAEDFGKPKTLPDKETIRKTLRTSLPGKTHKPMIRVLVKYGNVSVYPIGLARHCLRGVVKLPATHQRHAAYKAIDAIAELLDDPEFHEQTKEHLEKESPHLFS